MKRIAITTGDQDGIGLEVTQKALKKLLPLPGVQFYIWKGPKSAHLCDYKLNSFKIAPDDSPIIEVCSPALPPQWFSDAVDASKKKEIDAIVTGPMSKEVIVSSKLGKMGHTEMLQEAFPKLKPHMVFRGEDFNLQLITTHVPINNVEAMLTKDLVVAAVKSAKDFTAKIKDTRPIALVGLNPHAGENGLIGSKDKELSKICREEGIIGPLVPDAAFLKSEWPKYSLYLSCYHDQGLIPFKMQHNHGNSCQITWGLPVVRTSVDHGTAKDIFGLNKASEESMLYAIKMAIKLIKDK